MLVRLRGLLIPFLAVYFKADVRNIYFHRDTICCFMLEKGLELLYIKLIYESMQTISLLINLQSNYIFS